MSLCQCAIDTGEVPNAECDGVDVDALVFDGQALSVALEPVDAVEDAGVQGTIATRAKHQFAGVDNSDAGITARFLIHAVQAIEDAKRNISRSARHIEISAGLARTEPVDHGRLPEAVNTSAHEIVHEVVANRDVVKYGSNQLWLFIRFYGLKAEMRWLVSLAGDHEATIAQAPEARYFADQCDIRGTQRLIMPELPEVETVCRGLRARLLGRRIVFAETRRPDLRIPFPENFAERLIGRQIGSIERRAKYLLGRLDDGMVLICHLGMSGRLLISDAPPVLGPHDHVLIRFEGDVHVVMQDVRRFGLMTLASENEITTHPLLAGLGPEPLSDEFDGAYLSHTLKERRTPIKGALLDQRVVAGVGNIYACEALYHAGVSPRRLAASVAGRRAERLVPALKSVLEGAIAAGGSTLRDYVQASGELGYFQHQWAVYGREGEACPDCDCGSGIRRIVQSGRSTFYCPVRQR